MQDPGKNTEAILINRADRQRQVRTGARLRRLHGGVVINADSMQVYDTLRVVTARPDEEEWTALHIGSTAMCSGKGLFDR